MASNRNEPPKSSGDFDFFANFDEYADELEKEFEEEMIQERMENSEEQLSH